MNRIKILNSLIAKNNYKTYLEIGVQAGHCFAGVQCETKIGVDPDPSSAANIHQTSDDFFKSHSEAEIHLVFPDPSQNVTVPNKFDIIFIDGLHHADQVEKDISNSLGVLNHGGTIVMHDCLPTTERMQQIPLQEQQEWTGDTWKAFAKMRHFRKDLQMRVIDCDWGCGIIRPGEPDYPTIISTDVIDSDQCWEYFVKNKQYMMNIISVEKFKELYL